MLDSAPRTWTTGEVVNAPMLNTEIRDALVGLQAPWVAYTPVWTATATNPTLGNGSLVGAYHRIGATVFYRVLLKFGSSTDKGAGAYRWTLPVPAHTGGLGSSYFPLGTGVCQDTSTSERLMRHAAASGAAGTAVFLAGAGGDQVAADTFPWAKTDFVVVTGTYEAA